MKKLLKKYFGYDEFRPLQEEIVKNVMLKKDCFVLMSTGGGKSLCFQLPALKFKGLTLVISPLIALMKDQVDSLKECGVEAEFINSALSREEIDEICDRVRQKKVKLLYIAPERFALPYFKEFLQSLEISLIAIDEAHCISEWGHDFRPDYMNLNSLKKTFPGVPIIALTATATEQVRKDILKQLDLKKAKVFISSFNRENLKISVFEKKKAFPKLVALLNRFKNESVIIYCFSRKETEKIAENLKLNGFSARAYHAGLENQERRHTQELFVKDKVNIIVATIAFGMGIDKSDVRLVVHYSYPKTLEGYYQEIGRAGRDGLASECVLFYTYGDTRKHQFFIDQMQDTHVRELAESKLAEVVNYAELATCRKKYLLKYFGEEMEQDNCDSCDICLSEQQMFDATEIVQKIFSAVVRTGNKYGRNYVIDVLLGKKIQKIKRNNHTELSVFGIVNDFDSESLAYLFNQTINLGYLIKSPGQYPVLSLSKKGADFLNKKSKIELAKLKSDPVIQTDKGEIDYNKDLFAELRELRKMLAEKANIPPFMIFGDASLQEMSYYFPTTKEDFLKIAGVGAKKLDQYSEKFLKIIVGFIKSNKIKDIPKKEGNVKVRIEPDVVKVVVARPQFYMKTRQLLIKKINIDRIAKRLKLKPLTIINHIEKMIDAGELLDLEYLKLPSNKYKKMKERFEEYGDERLKPVFDSFKGKYSYDELRLVRVLMNT